jgi:GntR family transcriptional regulator, transcriptional repressor for pyruvate dehydrogenase complex
MIAKEAMKVVEKKRAYEDIVKQVLSLIESGKLKRGEQLPPERELAEIFKVSRMTVHKAVHTLQSMKLLKCQQGSSTYALVTRKDL